MDSKQERISEIQYKRSSKVIESLMQTIRKDIESIARNSKDMDDFKKKISFYTTINVFKSDKYIEQTNEVVNTITQALITNMR